MVKFVKNLWSAIADKLVLGKTHNNSKMDLY